MPNLELLGYGSEGLRLPDLLGLVFRCFREVSLEREAVVTIHYQTVVTSPYGGDERKPYLRLLTSEELQVITIVEAFQRNRIWEDLEIIAGGRFLFFDGKDIKTGLWRKKIPLRWKIRHYLKTGLWK